MSHLGSGPRLVGRTGLGVWVSVIHGTTNELDTMRHINWRYITNTTRKMGSGQPARRQSLSETLTLTLTLTLP